MKQAGTLASASPNAISSTIKIFLFVIPAAAVEQFFPGRPILFGASFIVGALLQALIPPRTYRLKYIFGMAFGAAFVVPLIYRFAGQG